MQPFSYNSPQIMSAGLLIRARNLKLMFSLSTKTYVVASQKNCLIDYNCWIIKYQDFS